MRKAIVQFFRDIFKRDVTVHLHQDPSCPNRVSKLVESTFVHESLGITDDRMDELTMLVKKIHRKHDDIVLIIEGVSAECKHPNELFMITFWLRGYIDDHQRRNVIQAFIAGQGGSPPPGS